MTILTIAGSPTRRSRSGVLLHFVADRLAERGLEAQHVTLSDIPAEDLIFGRYDSPAVKVFATQLKAAEVVVIATPVYKASFSGGLKAALDLLPENALAGKIVLPIATGGSLAHLLALEYGLKPVLSALGARHILAGVYATEKQVRWIDEARAELDQEIVERLDEACEWLGDFVDQNRNRRTPLPATNVHSFTSLKVASA